MGSFDSSYYKSHISILVVVCRWFRSFCSRISSFLHLSDHSFLRSWNVLKYEENSEWTADNHNQDLRRNQKRNFSKAIRSLSPTVTKDRASKLIPVLLTRIFLIFLPVRHKRRRLFCKRTLKFNKENLIVTQYFLGVPAKIMSVAVNARGRMPWCYWLATAYSVDLHPSKGVTCVQLFKRQNPQQFFERIRSLWMN